MSDKIIDVKGIMERIPHRYPFLLVDRVVDYEKGKWIKGIKNVTMNELFFQGHFPGEPVMPGVLIVEALAQTGGLLSLIDDSKSDKIALFMTIDKVKFRKPVTPGDQLVLKATVKKVVRDTIMVIHGEASVDGTVVCEGDLMFATADKPE